MAASVVNGAALFSFTTGMLLECKICEALVDAKEIAAHQYQEIWDGDPLPWESRDTFVTCPRCNEPMPAHERDWGQGWEKPVRIYPTRDRDLHDSVPKAIQEAFMEARSCIRAKALQLGQLCAGKP